MFEKLNGYKEGSFFTPSFITNYMCEQSLQKIIVAKFNEKLNFHCKNIDDLKIALEFFIKENPAQNQAKAKEIFYTLSILDPSVGSGHFLVSSLNWLIKYMFDLGLINDLFDCKLELLNDEIFIKDSKNLTHKYTIPAHENIQNHKIQKAIFNIKKDLISSCLFGVDINPNSCEITKLRLWIELLKHTFYKDIKNKYLQTLPNIDINIKCGNSLISHFALDSKLGKNIKTKFGKNLKEKIKSYKPLVCAYKYALVDKKKIEGEIDEIKQTLCSILKDTSALNIKINKNIKELVNQYGKEIFSILIDWELQARKIAEENNFGFRPSFEQPIPKASDAHALKLKEIIKNDLEHFNNLGKDSLEWRFEFPEILNDEGEFLGFDLVIGNPPYITKHKTQYPQYKWNTDLYMMFFEIGFKLAKQNGSGYVNLITPRFWLVNINCENMRKYFLNSIHLIALSETNPFEKAVTENIITEFQVCKSKLETIKHYKETNKIFNFIDIINKNDFNLNANNEIIFGINGELLKLFNKINKNTIQFKTIIESKRGAEYGKKFIKNFSNGMKILLGYDLQSYIINWNNTFVDSNLKDIQRLLGFFEMKNLIFLRRVDKKLSASISDKKFAFSKNIYGLKVMDSKYSHKFILALLNSKLLNFYYLKKFTTKKQEVFPEIQTYLYEQLPIPKITTSNKNKVDKIIALVDKILESKAQDSAFDTSHLESQIDKLVYDLYDLTPDEIKIIES